MHLLRILLGGAEPLALGQSSQFRAQVGAQLCESALTRASAPRSVAGVARTTARASAARLFVAVDLPDEVREGSPTGARASWPTRPCGRCGRSRCTSPWPSSATGRRRRSSGSTRRCGELRGPALLMELEARCTAAAAAGRALRAAGAVSRRRADAGRQAELAEILRSSGLYKAEKRPFWPHVTVARVRQRVADRGARAGSMRPPGTVSDGSHEAFYAVRIDALPF